MEKAIQGEANDGQDESLRSVEWSEEYFKVPAFRLSSGKWCSESQKEIGTGEENHSIMPKTEWWIAFYQPDSVTPADDLPHGWLAEDRSAQGDFDRVPVWCKNSAEA